MIFLVWYGNIIHFAESTELIMPRAAFYMTHILFIIYWLCIANIGGPTRAALLERPATGTSSSREPPAAVTTVSWSDCGMTMILHESVCLIMY